MRTRSSIHGLGVPSSRVSFHRLGKMLWIVHPGPGTNWTVKSGSSMNGATALSPSSVPASISPASMPAMRDCSSGRTRPTSLLWCA